MNILDLAAENFLITFAVVLGIGFLQGMIMGRGIRNRFPSIKKHAQDEKLRYDKLEKMSFCCLRLLEIYREYTKKLKNKE